MRAARLYNLRLESVERALFCSLRQSAVDVDVASQRLRHQNIFVMTRIYDIFAIDKSLPDSRVARILWQRAANASIV